MRPASGNGEEGAWDLGGWMETTAVFPSADERRFFCIDARVDVDILISQVIIPPRNVGRITVSLERILSWDQEDKNCA